MEVTEDEQGWFKPEKLKNVMMTVSTITLLIFLTPVFIAGAVNGGLVAVLGGVFSLAVLGLMVWYVSAYYRTVYYRIGDDDVEYRGGVFFKKQTSVPYERITHVDTRQGPLLRFFDAGAVEIQTAGQSAQAGAELVIKSVSDFEGIKEKIREKANRTSSEQVSKEDTGKDVSETVEELRKIRKLLDERL